MNLKEIKVFLSALQKVGIDFSDPSGLEKAVARIQRYKLAGEKENKRNPRLPKRDSR